jgi:hypothetical protein
LSLRFFSFVSENFPHLNFTLLCLRIFCLNFTFLFVSEIFLLFCFFFPLIREFFYASWSVSSRSTISTLFYLKQPNHLHHLKDI